MPQLLALSNRAIFKSCLAAVASQYSLVSDHGHKDAQRYCNEAIRMSYERLNDREDEPALFASCCLFTTHCEMVESKASDWNLHLKVARGLVLIRHWNGRSGGLAQANESNIHTTQRLVHLSVFGSIAG
jgi:hypothetical protein